MFTRFLRRLRPSVPLLLVLTLLVPLTASANDPDPTHVLGDDVADTPLEVDQQHHKAQHGSPAGHLPGSSSNVQLVGKLRVHDAAPGRISDVAAMGNYAYLGVYWEPDCKKGGVYVIDISNPSRPKEAGFIRTANGSYVSEGVQVIQMDTAHFTGDLLIHNNEICAAGGIGGVSLVDVTNPRRPAVLAAGIGDFTNPNTSVAHQVHSAFAWDAGDRAYAVLVDDEEALDVDIMDITDPRSPVLIKETGLPDWPAAQSPLANGNTVFFHDVQVRQFDGRWLMLLSYWDAGWILLDVTDPAQPVFIDDTDYPDPDSLTDFSPPEGNAHQAWWDSTGRFFVGTDEDFSPERLTTFEITTGPNAGEYEAGIFGFAKLITTLPDNTLNGPTVYGGYGCNDDVGQIPSPAVLGALAPGEEKIVVLSRGPVDDPNHPHGACRFDEKIQNAANAGYDAAIIGNHHSGAGGGAFPDAAFCGSGDPRGIFATCIGHRAMHLLFSTTPDYTTPYPAGDPADLEPDPGELGAHISAVAAFDGWGYVRLIDAKTLREIDSFAIPEALDENLGAGFGDLTVHEVETDPDTNLAYVSWYAGGFRVLKFGRQGIEEVGHYIDANGNNFWGIHPHTDPRDGSRILLLSDRDSGLWIFRYTGPRP